MSQPAVRSRASSDPESVVGTKRTAPQPETEARPELRAPADLRRIIASIGLGAWWRAKDRRLPIVVGLLIAVPSLILRLWQLNFYGLNTDEAIYAGQAASLAGDPRFIPYFPVFRAHPLLFHLLLSVDFRIQGVSPTAGRLLSVLFGMATVALAYAIGARLYDRRVGVLAALIVGLMPYAVIVSRQILLDSPMTFFATLVLYLLVRYVQSERPAWLYAAAAALGLTVLCKETGIILLGGAYAFFALTRKVKVSLRQAGIALAVLFVVIFAYPLSLRFSGKASTGGAFLTWQLFRRPNHTWTFYPLTVTPAIGLAVVAVIIVGLLALRRSLGWREHLLVAWLAAPCVFFELWAVKGFQYLLPAAVPLAVLAAMAIAKVPLPRIPRTVAGGRIPAATLRVVLGVLVLGSLAVTSWIRVQPAAAGTQFLAGTGGVPGGREAGQWVAANTPTGSELLAVGPSMANIVQFYGHRRVFGLSVSPNPLYRNPVYEPVNNPDLQIRRGDLQYLVWDSYSASRSPFFSRHLLAFAERYHGRIVHQELVSVPTAAGPVSKPVVVIYEVSP
jgi:hypothetical protein